ncbi:MAG TPA: HAMP domain-containing sensor histidine kinase [Candidatus Limnocylindrales bacterium]|nr:HAMP domain-containing sensor histidine kinase [Candidatus Limnocylindrales bacterium]
MKLAKSTWLIILAWVVFVGGFAVGSLLIPPGNARTAFGDIALCIGPLFANACLLWNASSAYRRQNNFWMLLAFGCTLWLAGRLIATYRGLVLHTTPHALSGVDLIFFLHTVPLMAALALLPHARKMRETLRYGYLDLLLLGVWWTFLYLFMAMAWAKAPGHSGLDRVRDLQVYAMANLVFVAGAGFLAIRAKRGWRKVYANLFGASVMYVLGVALWVTETLSGKSQPGALSTLPIMAAFVWFGTAGIVAHRISPVPEVAEDRPARESQWPAQLAILCILSMPVMAAWSAFFSHAPAPVRNFRLMLTLITIIVGASLVFLRQQLVDRERLSLMKGLQDSLEHLKRLQMQFVQAEKLASLGQLAAGAAHEINNPLTAILGYADMIQSDTAATEHSRTLGMKIREQARRTKVLVTNLLSFARQVPAEKQLLDLKSVLTSAIELRQLDLRDKKIRIEVDNPAVIPAVRGDPNQLLQVFYNLISNAVDAMETVGGGVLTVRMRTERGSVVLDFSDTGPGLRDPERVFDPFYTTKPVGKGTGLGLSICYGIVQEHGGQIFGFNRPEGGCTLRVVLPAVLALFPHMATPAPVNTR